MRVGRATGDARLRRGYSCAMALLDDLTKDLTASMKARDTQRTSVLRMAKAALKNREIDKRGALDETEVVAVLVGLVKQREESASEGDLK